MKQLLELFKSDYEDCIDFTCADTKYEWAASNIFDLSTYDGALDERFVKAIIEVCKVILDRRNYEYIEDENNYVKLILVCQLLDRLGWIEWGTSIRGAWFENYGQNSKPIFTYYDSSCGEFKEIPFTIDNLKTLITFMESEVDSNGTGK